MKMKKSHHLEGDSKISVEESPFEAHTQDKTQRKLGTRSHINNKSFFTKIQV